MRKKLNIVSLREIMKRRKAFNKALGVLSTAAELPNNSFMKAMNNCILGRESIEDLKIRVLNKEFI